MKKLATILILLIAISAHAEDFSIQRGVFTQAIGVATATLTNGVHYTLDADSTISNAFIRITNARLCGSGNSIGDSIEDCRYSMVSITNPSNLLISVDFVRYKVGSVDMIFTWEIIEYVGQTGGKNEIIVRDQAQVDVLTPDHVTTGTVVSTVSDTNRVVVFITGQRTDGGNDRPPRALHWSSITTLKEPVFERRDNGGLSSVSYAVVEFTGSNWTDIRRVKHINTELTETVVFSPAVADTNKTFFHAQPIPKLDVRARRQAASVWLSNINEITIDANDDDTGAVIWLVENTETDPKQAMRVQHIQDVTTLSTNTIFTLPIDPVVSMANTSIMGESAYYSDGDRCPSGQLGFLLIGDDEVMLWTVIDDFQSISFCVVQWPAAIHWHKIIDYSTGTNAISSTFGGDRYFKLTDCQKASCW